MGENRQKRKVLKGFTVLALTSSIILGSLGQVSNAASPSKAEDILANLTAQQRTALKELSTNEESGIQISSDINLDSTEQASVIVEFVNQPVKVAQIEASVEGKTLTKSDAEALIDQDHDTFTKDVAQVLKNEKSKKVDYKINRSYKHAFNGVSMTLPQIKLRIY